MALCGILRQSTAIDVLIGPFVDSSDGATPETGLTIDVEVSKNGEALAEKSDITAPTHDGGQEVDGYYNCELDATDTNTVGTLTLACFASGALSVRHDYVVVEEAVYDLFFAASATGQVTVASIANGAITAAAIATGAIDADAIADGAIDAGAFAAGAITASAIAADAIGASELAADAVAEIADAVWDEDATAHQTQGTFGQAIGDPVADTNTIYKAVVTDATGATVGVDVAAVLDDTGTSGVALANDSITAAKIANGAIDAATFAADVDAEILSYLVDDATRIDASSLNTATVTTIPAILVDTAEIGAAGAGLTAINLPDQTMNITGDITGNLSGSVGSVTGAVGSVTGNVGGNVVGSVASVTAPVTVGTNNDKTGYRLSSTGVDDVLRTALTEGYAADGAAPTLEQFLYMVWTALSEFAISGTTITCKKLDGTTTSMTFTLDSATDPTSRTRAT